MTFVRNMPLFYEYKVYGHKMIFSHFLFMDINAPYPYYPLASLKNGVFDKVCQSEELKEYGIVVIGH